MFVLEYRGNDLFRRRGHLEWLDLPARARKLGWDGREYLEFRDADGLALGGFVPNA